jgi:hypothetical protein
LRIERLPYSLDLSHCDFFLFGDILARMKLLSYETSDKLEHDITKTIEGIPKGTLTGVFHASKRRFEQCIQNEGNYFEETLPVEILF